MTLLRVEEVTKRYRVGVGRARVREMLPWPLDGAVERAFPKWWRRDTFNALTRVSLEIPQGTSLGLVGHNGAGKTTLLRVMAGVTNPTSGRVRVQGRIAALIDALVGFHPDLTGRENVFLLGSMYGMGRKTMAARIDDILSFADITDMADTPVKRYSAGMMARLGFAVVAHLDPEIVMVDEILAVGDASFQRKCIDWLDEYRKQGGTLLFVSHNLQLVRSMTERVVWIDHGRVVGDGPTGEVLADYAGAIERRSQDQHNRARPVKGWQAQEKLVGRGQMRWGAGGARVEEIHLGDPDGENSSVDVCITYHAEETQPAIFCIGFVDEGGRQIGAASSPHIDLTSGTGRLTCTIEPLPLRSGIYFPVVAILTPDGIVRDHWRLERPVVVEGNGQVLTDTFGPVDISATWSPRS